MAPAVASALRGETCLADVRFELIDQCVSGQTQEPASGLPLAGLPAFAGDKHRASWLPSGVWARARCSLEGGASRLNVQLALAAVVRAAGQPTIEGRGLFPGSSSGELGRPRRLRARGGSSAHGLLADRKGMGAGAAESRPKRGSAHSILAYEARLRARPVDGRSHGRRGEGSRAAGVARAQEAAGRSLRTRERPGPGPSRRRAGSSSNRGSRQWWPRYRLNSAPLRRLI